jgi:hypothetical protein
VIHSLGGARIQNDGGEGLDVGSECAISNRSWSGVFR